jgi:hypothetical protein
MLKASAHRIVVLILFGLSFVVSNGYAQESAPSKELALYHQIKSFALTGGAVDVKGLVIKKDRAQITLDGIVYLTGLSSGRYTGAVFIGDGKFSLETPPGEFEKVNMKRLIGGEVLESDFKTAIFRFSDDPAQEFGNARNEPVNEGAQRLATESEARLLRETGANLSARIATSILNQEKPGFFTAIFDGGKRGRFSLLLDYQTRIPVANFDLNAGEKGLIFKYTPSLSDTEVWAAFYSPEDYQRRRVEYSDANDLVDVKNYDMSIDLREHKKRLRILTRMTAQVGRSNIRALGFKIGENLPEDPEWRLNKQMRLKSVKLDGRALASAQENWEGGFTIFFPEAVAAGSNLVLDLELDGDFMYDSETVENCHYPRSNESWFPRHGYLDRATFNITYRHPKKLHIASVGARLSEEADPEDKDSTITKYQMTQPVPLVTFALAPFERHPDTIKWEKGGSPTPLEFNSLPGSEMAIKEDFILAELNNSVRYFTAMFGDYPYPAFSAAFHPFRFGQGFPSLLMIPATDRANKRTYQFIAHETAHQWWGGIVAWRSYRDQWLSEGFAQYSGILYTGMRQNVDAKNDLLGELRSSLRDVPETESGVGKGRLVDVGPIILGHRLATRKTYGAYEALIYNKGALVLRMLHFMLSNPGTGEGQPFFDMMTDFVNRYRNQAASTDDFRLVANEHFARTPIAKQYNIPDLNWLFREMVYQTALPSYEMQYHITDEPEGKVLISGTITQSNAPADWLMILPVKFEFGNNQRATGTLLANGPATPFKIRLPMRPRKVELDPDHWIIADKISTKAN